MAKREVARWVGVVLFGVSVFGSFSDHSFAFVPAFIGFCLLFPPIEKRIAMMAKQRGFSAYTASWFKPVAIVIMVLMIGALLPKSSADVSQDQPGTAKVANNPSSPIPSPAPVFNVPDLLGKNIDEMKAMLGEPKDWVAPTKKVSDVITMWDMTFEKDGVSLDASYNIKTKVVDYLFLDGGDKKTLLAQGGLDENSKDYVMKFVNQINDKNVLLGVKIAKKLPDNLDASISTSLAGITIKNSEPLDWPSCEIKVNDRKYSYDKIWGVQSGDSHTISYADLTTSDGTRFNVFVTKPKDIYLRCNNSVQEDRWGYYTF